MRMMGKGKINKNLQLDRAVDQRGRLLCIPVTLISLFHKNPTQMADYLSHHETPGELNVEIRELSEKTK